jgi:hypothetical protein
MYQAEVKRCVIEFLFPPTRGWKVVVHLDPMERGVGQSIEKQEKAAQCVMWFRAHGVEVMVDREYGKRDIVARHPNMALPSSRPRATSRASPNSPSTRLSAS